MSEANGKGTADRRLPAKAKGSEAGSPVPADAPVKPVPASGNGVAPTPDELRADIAVTRAEIGDTVAELAVRLNIRRRARERAAELRAQAQPYVKPAALGAALAVALTSVWLGVRSRRR